jgi:RNA polymerase sigma-70 factor (ECF subfamily)
MHNDATTLLLAVSGGDRSKVEDLLSVLYGDLHAMASRFMSRESAAHTFQTTDLLNEAFIRLIDQSRVNWAGKTHFMAISAQSMRRILVDHARAKHRSKRGGRGRLRLELRDDHAITLETPEQILAVDEALEKLAALDPTQARVLECRLFGGMGLAEIGECLGLTSRVVERHWNLVRAWLLRELAEPRT